MSGHVNPSLTELGKQQALEAGQKLKDVRFDTVYSSDLQRAAHTAELVYGKPVPPEHQLPQLRERNFGSFDGGPIAHFREHVASRKHIYDALTEEEQWQHKHADDVESDDEVAVRFVTALEGIALKHPGETVLVAAHGGTLRTMLIKLGYATAKELPSGSFKNAGYVKLVFADGEFTVEHVDGIEKH